MKSLTCKQTIQLPTHILSLQMESITRVATKTNPQLQTQETCNNQIAIHKTTIKKLLESNYKHITIVCKSIEQEPPTQMEMENPPLLYQSPTI